MVTFPCETKSRLVLLVSQFQLFRLFMPSPLWVSVQIKRTILQLIDRLLTLSSTRFEQNLPPQGCLFPTFHPPLLVRMQMVWNFDSSSGCGKGLSSQLSMVRRCLRRGKFGAPTFLFRFRFYALVQKLLFRHGFNSSITPQTIPVAWTHHRYGSA